jgi:hypothetical protein
MDMEFDVFTSSPETDIFWIGKPTTGPQHMLTTF